MYKAQHCMTSFYLSYKQCSQAHMLSAGSPQEFTDSRSFDFATSREEWNRTATIVSIRTVSKAMCWETSESQCGMHNYGLSWAREYYPELNWSGLNGSQYKLHMLVQLKPRDDITHSLVYTDCSSRNGPNCNQYKTSHVSATETKRWHHSRSCLYWLQF